MSSRAHATHVYSYIISLVCPLVVVLSIHSSQFLIPKEEDDGRGGGG
jgi:hypothetical protein